MINKLLTACDQRFQAERHGKTCINCTYAGHCPNNCEECLELVHFPSRVVENAPPRKYDCKHMADFYVCKYGYKYVSELIYAFRLLRDLQNRQNLKVLSFGCGPCTDLLALDYLRQSGEYVFETLEYHGVDYNMEVWKNIHDNLNQNSSNGINNKFFNLDARQFINEIINSEWKPDLVVFQYFFSDMVKNVHSSAINSFINAFSTYMNLKMPINSYVVMNDINLSTIYSGGREYLDELQKTTNEFCDFRRRHFMNNSRHNTFEYGQKIENNNLIFNPSLVVYYNPFRSCSSAQMILKKTGETL